MVVKYNTQHVPMFLHYYLITKRIQGHGGCMKTEWK